MPDADSSGVHLLVIAKEPLPGRVKTRLTPPYSPEDAASLATAALADTLAAVAAVPAAARTVVLDGAPGSWLPPGFAVVPQRGDGLDERLAAAFADAQQSLAAPMLLVGMDTPQVTPDLLGRCAALLMSPGTDAVLGTAEDGGWWALGLRQADERLLLGVPMSTAHTGADQHERLVEHGLSVTMLPTLTDVDDAASAAAVAEEALESRFASRLAELDQAVGVAS